MFKIPKQEYTTEFKGLSVKRVQGSEGIAQAARELGLVEQTLRNWVKAAKAGEARSRKYHDNLSTSPSRATRYLPHAILCSRVIRAMISWPRKVTSIYAGASWHTGRAEHSGAEITLLCRPCVKRKFPPLPLASRLFLIS